MKLRHKSAIVFVMTIHLRPELEQLIQADVEREPYTSIDQFVEQAVQLLHEHEEWLSENRAEIEAQIEQGYAAARRGELIEDSDVRRQMARMKEAL